MRPKGSPLPEAPATEVVPQETDSAPLAIPPREISGIEEFGGLRNWVSLDAPRGKPVCRALGSECDGFAGHILESRAVRVMKEPDGSVFCASADRITADTGPPGRECAFCEDRDQRCFLRWWIA
jgi:hypothetical protein